MNKGKVREMNKGKVRETNKEKILEILFDSSKTTAELAHELGYVNPDGTARYNMINSDLKRLVEKRYLKSERVKKESKSGNTPTLYSIDFSIQSLRNMIEEYPYLISKMKRKNLVLEAIFHEYLDFTYNLNENYKKIETNEFAVKINKEDLTKKLELSNEFFKFVLINDRNKLIHYTKTIAETFNENINTKLCKEKNSLNYNFLSLDDKDTKREIYFGFDIAFKACIIKDIMDGKSTTDAIEYIKQMRNKVPDEQIETEKQIE